MKAESIVEMALPYVSQVLDDSEDLLILARPMLNVALQEVLEVENCVRRSGGREELASAPWVETLEQDIPYCDGLTRRALPYWLAYRFLQDDDQDGRALYYYNEYVNALSEVQRAELESVVDVYG